MTAISPSIAALAAAPNTYVDPAATPVAPPPTAAAPVAVTPPASAPATLPGTLPAAADPLGPATTATDYTTSPTPLDAKDETYPTLIRWHVMVLRAIGTPELMIGQIAGTQPQAEYMDRYIQGQILQNPEGWDAQVGNPIGTARAGLAELGLEAAPLGKGHPGVLADGTKVDDPSGNMGMIKGLAIGAGVVGVGLLGWKFFSGRGAGEAGGLLADAVRGGGTGAAEAMGTVATSIGRGGRGRSAAEARTLASSLAGLAGTGPAAELGASMLREGTRTGNAELIKRGAVLGTLVGSGGAPAASGVHSVLNGLAPGNGVLTSVAASAKQAGVPFETMFAAHLLEGATQSHQLGDLATASAVARGALTEGASTVARASDAGMEPLLAAIRQLLPAT